MLIGGMPSFGGYGTRTRLGRERHRGGWNPHHLADRSVHPVMHWCNRRAIRIRWIDLAVHDYLADQWLWTHQTARAGEVDWRAIEHPYDADATSFALVRRPEEIVTVT